MSCLTQRAGTCFENSCLVVRLGARGVEGNMSALPWGLYCWTLKCMKRSAKSPRHIKSPF